ncbi:aminotransferase class III-fold pyridoxal phosphate-dependent enzyme [Arthrobacter sp. MI7-26]|nr:aminotransferase class III-fold pyridoxal phosphate-dependent enzyme [Arthrobacter sp. MI7-26]
MTLADREPLPIFVSGKGCYVQDIEGRSYLDGISTLGCVNLGYSFGAEMGAAAAAQLTELGFHSNFGSTHPRAIELAEKIASLAPSGMERVILLPDGSTAIDAAWKLARQYHTIRGDQRWKAISRNDAYHGTTLGSGSLNGIAAFRHGFEPMLAPGVSHIRNAVRYRRPEGETEEHFTQTLLGELEAQILNEDPSTVAMVLMEPVQTSGGCIVPPKGYAAGVREICDRYGILLAADEVITAFGRLGAWFGSELLEMKPDIIITAKGLSSAHGAIAAVVASEEVYDPFYSKGIPFVHGNTFGGHPVQAAIALKNIEILEREGIPGHVRSNSAELRGTLEKLLDLPIVGDVRGTGFMYGIELVQDKESKEPFPFSQNGTPGTVSPADVHKRLMDEGVMIRFNFPGQTPVISVMPPLVADTPEFEHLGAALTKVLSELSDFAA